MIHSNPIKCLKTWCNGYFLLLLPKIDTIYFVHMKLRFFIICALFTTLLVAQDIAQLKNIDVSTLTDTQIASYWASIQKNGYTMEQVEVLGQVQGIPASKLAEFKRRVNGLSISGATNNAIVKAETDLVLPENSVSLKEGDVSNIEPETTALFGFDFFKNAKVSFTPSVHLSVPDNYQIGPGDEIMIDLWGAAEITYKATVTNAGDIKIAGLGFIYINGFTLADARKKIISKLKQKHAGIAEANSSYYKINTNITVSKIRTVQVNIIGEVKVPGTYALNSLSTVLNALYVSGGPTKTGTFRAVKLIRNDKEIATLDVYQYLLNGTQKGNLKLQDQDVLLVGPYKNVVTVEGAVKRPGVYELLEHEVLQDLIHYFGGFTSNAYKGLLVVERFNGKEKEVKEVFLNEAANFKMMPGDRLVIQNVSDKFINKIAIDGEVYRPGSFELKDNISLRQLIEKAGGVTPEAFLDRGLLVRTFDEATKESLSFSVVEVLSGKTTITLQARDNVYIYAKEALKEKETIQIQGAVNKPQTIDFIDKLQVEDVIAMSGGLQAGADPEVIIVSRRLKDGRFKTISSVFSRASETNLGITKTTPFYLEPFDIVNVRYAKGYVAQQSVTVSGEVKYKGAYVLKNKNERISDVIERAGGFTEYAYLKGARLLRNGKPVGINLEAILANKGTAIDLFLNEGDALIVPSESQTVSVTGDVFFPSLVQFEAGKSLKAYINNSGGFTKSSEKGKVYVYYANGEVKSVKRFLFFKTYPKLAPGATIFVPKKEVSTNRMTTAEVIGITSSIITLGILIQNLNK